MGQRVGVLVVVGLVVACGAAWAGPEAAARQVVPAVAHTAGADGSSWSTELVVHNPSSTAALVTVTLLPSGGGPGATVTLDGALAPHATAVVADVVASLFPGSSLGALVVEGAGETGAPVELVVSSRTFTPAATGAGTLGQGIPAVPWRQDGDLAALERVLPGLEASDDFRSNVGLVNLSPTAAATFSVEVLDQWGDSHGQVAATLPPGSHLQRNNLLAELGLEGGGFSGVVRLVATEPAGAAVDFVAYASRVDRHSNDPAFVEPQPAVATIGAERRRLVPAVANTPGAAGTYWRTDLTLTNPGEENGLFVRLKLIPSGLEGAAADPPEVLVGLGAHQTLSLADVLGQRFPDHAAGALVVEGKNRQGGIVDLRVDSRTWTADPGGNGSYGQGIPGLALLEGGEPAVVAGLEASAAYRSNLGLVNPSFNLRQTFRVEVFGPSGASHGTLSATLGPWAQWQLNDVLGQLGLEGAGFSAVVSVAASENLQVTQDESWQPVLVAYGSRVDQLTGDPTYLAAAPLKGAPEREEGAWYDFVGPRPWYLCPGEEPPPADATVVVGFDRADHSFGAEDRRTLVQEVVFPPAQDWDQVGLEILLECPESGLCDHWDRTATLQLVTNPEAPEAEWQVVELARYITPYRVGMCTYVDVTPLGGLLAGTRTLRSFVDTWVGPGNSSGEGWRVTTRFVFYPGAARQADQVVPVWGFRNVVLGSTDPALAVDAQLEAVTVPIPADATRVEAHLVTTGHAYENGDNCAEFCPLRQDLSVGGVTRSVLPWRSDCEFNPVLGQQGTWRYDRNGWCPGAVAVGDRVDVTDLVTPGADAVLGLDVRDLAGEVWVNSAPGSWLPNEWVSLVLYIWRE